MLVQQGLLNAIRDYPDHEDLKLILADWLDDHDQAPRAELIRLQCQIDQLRHRDAQRFALQERVDALIKAHGKTWLGTTPSHLTQVHLEHGGITVEGAIQSLTSREDREWWDQYGPWVVKATFTGGSYYWRQAIDQGRLNDIPFVSGDNLEADVVARLAALPNLRKLKLFFVSGEERITRKSRIIQALADAQQLQAVELRIRTRSGSLSSLTQLRTLTRLTIDVPRYDGDLSLTPLTRIPSLDHLYLYNGGDPEDAIKVLANATSLKTFLITHILLSRQTMSSVRSLTWAEEMRLCPTSRVGRNWMRNLEPLIRLRYLDLSESDYIEEGNFLYLRDLPELEELNLDHSNITENGLTRLNTLSRLKRLYMQRSRFAGISLRQLLPLTELTTLDLGHSQVDGTGLKYLARMPSLRWVNLMATEVTQNEAEQLRRDRPDLMVLR